MHLYGIQRKGTDEPSSRAGMETKHREQRCRHRQGRGGWGLGEQVVLQLLILCKAGDTPGSGLVDPGGSLQALAVSLQALLSVLITSWGLGGKNEGVMEAACLGEGSTPKQGSRHQGWSAALVSCVTQSRQVTGAHQHCKQG